MLGQLRSCLHLVGWTCFQRILFETTTMDNWWLDRWNITTNQALADLLGFIVLYWFTIMSCNTLYCTCLSNCLSLTECAITYYYYITFYRFFEDTWRIAWYNYLERERDRDSNIDIITNNGYITRFWARKRSASAEAGVAIFLHMENINYLPVNQHGNENPPFWIRNKSSIHLQMVEFLLLIAMLIYRSAMCCENSHHFKHLHFGDVGQARFEDIHRKNLTFGVTFPSPSRKKNEVPSFSREFVSSPNVNPTKMAALCQGRLLFFGAPNRPLCASNLRAIHPKTTKKKKYWASTIQ